MVIDNSLVQKSRQHYWFYLFSFLVSVSVFTYLLSTVSINEVVVLLKGLTTRWVFLFLFLSFSMSFFRTWRYRILLQVSGYQPDVAALFLITLVRNFFSDLLPARLGTLIYIYLVQNRLRVPFGPAASSFTFSFIFDKLSLAFLIVLAVLIGSSEFISPVVVAGGGVLLAALSITVLLILPEILLLAAKLLLAMPLFSENSRKKICNFLDDARDNIVLAQQRGIYWQVFSLSLGVRVCKYLSLYVLLLALVIPLGYTSQYFGLSKVFLGLCSAELAASLPISGIAGFGAYEGAWALVFQLLGYSEHIAVLTSISHHLLTQVYGYSLGAAAILALLFPVFKKTMIKEQFVTQQQGLVFWGKLVMITSFVLLFSYLLLPDKNILLNDPVSRASMNNNQSVAQENRNVIEKPSGRIVYQRNDGIYILDLKTNEGKRLVSFGSYPRWSPDGRYIAFVHNNNIMMTDVTGLENKILATAQRARAVCFAPDGKAVFYTDGKKLQRVELQSKKITTILKDDELREIDISNNGKMMTATVRTPLGLRVRVFDLVSGAVQTVARGCSASLSPDSTLVTVNGQSHDKLYLFKLETLEKSGYVSSPYGMKFDNQYWSNDAQWIVSTSEGNHRDIYIHHVPSDSSFQLTETGDSDRADLFVSPSMP